MTDDNTWMCPEGGHQLWSSEIIFDLQMWRLLFQESREFIKWRLVPQWLSVLIVITVDQITSRQTGHNSATSGITLN